MVEEVTNIVDPKIRAYTGVKPVSFSLLEQQDHDGDPAIQVTLYYEDAIANSEVPYKDLVAVQNMFYDAIDKFEPEISVYFFLDSALHLNKQAT